MYGRLAGYEDVNDAARLARDPAMRAIVGREGLERPAASTSQMVAVPRPLFAAILRRIERLRGAPVSAG